MLNLLADNCSWIYLDGTLVGFQDVTLSPRTYPVTLSGAHLLEFIIFDGGGAAGGMYRLETKPPGVEFADTDSDGLTDPQEHLYGTDPNDPDSDDDGVSDGAEVAAGTDPLAPPSDTTPPVITPTVTGTLGNNGWYTSDVNVSWTVTDPNSTVASQTGCGPTTVSTDTASITFTCTATSTGGTASRSVTLKRDATAPVVIASALPGPNGNLWNNSNVTVSYVCTDGGSGVDAAASHYANDVLSASGTATGTCVDEAGNSASDSYAALIDKVKPVLAPVVSPNPVAINGAAVASANATDALSGVDTFGCAAVDTSAIGPGTVSCTATDKAGNTQSASAAYLVTVVASKQAVLDAINAELATASKRDRSELREAARKLTESLDPRNWVDGNHLQLKRGAHVFEDEKEAVQKLRELLKDRKSGVADASLQSWIDTLVTIDRALAQIAIDEAVAEGGNARQVAEANKEMARAADRLAKGKPAEAIEHYKHAWQKLQKHHERDGHEDDDHDS